MKLGLKEIAACAALACSPIEGCKSDTDITTQPPKKNWIAETSAECHRQATEASGKAEYSGSPRLELEARQMVFQEKLEACMKSVRP